MFIGEKKPSSQRFTIVVNFQYSNIFKRLRKIEPNTETNLVASLSILRKFKLRLISTGYFFLNQSRTRDPFSLLYDPRPWSSKPDAFFRRMEFKQLSARKNLRDKDEQYFSRKKNKTCSIKFRSFVQKLFFTTVCEYSKFYFGVCWNA